jgi:hypothetical protein
VNLPPWQADSQSPTAPQRLSDDDDTAPLPVVSRPSSAAAASNFGAASTHVLADPAAASSFTLVDSGGTSWPSCSPFGTAVPRGPLWRCAL